MRTSTLIRRARLYGTDAIADVRLRDGRIESIAADQQSRPGEALVDAAGACLLPGLHDHHIHLVSLAAALDSLHCGPPAIASEAELAGALQAADKLSSDWLRGIAYHPSVAGDIDRHWLDRHSARRPVRIQHRGGRLWVLNSAALEALGVLEGGSAPAGLECIAGQPSGRLYEEDVWLRQRLGSRFPELGRASRLLASYGVTGITDTTPHNGAAEWSQFAASLASGSLLQRVRMMGASELENREDSALLQRGELKIHLLESQLPDFEQLCAKITSAHELGRAVAVHCVTLTELLFTLGALEVSGSITGDRIEHASVTPDEQLAQMRRMGLRVVTQPHFISERGDQYLREVEAQDQPWLYRCRAFLDAGVPLAAGSDAAFGSADPWAAMRAAVERRTPAGVLMGGHERLTPEQALALYLSPAEAPGLGSRLLEVGATADLCLLRLPWARAREQLDSALVRAVWRDGELIHRVD